MEDNQTQQNSLKIEKVSDTIHRLQQDMAQIGALVSRLDVTLEKITEVSVTVSQLLAVQGNRIEFHEKEAEKLARMLEERRNEQSIYIKDVYARIESVEYDLRKEVNLYYQKVSDKIDSSQAANDGSRKEFNKEITDRLSRLEKWIWSLAGGGIVTIWLINNIDITKIF